MNPQYEEIGKGFVQEYYKKFDSPGERMGLVNLYNVSKQSNMFRFHLDIHFTHNILAKLLHKN